MLIKYNDPKWEFELGTPHWYAKVLDYYKLLQKLYVVDNSFLDHVRYQVRWRSGRSVRTWAVPYFWFSTNPPEFFFLAFKGSRHGMTLVWSLEIWTSRWTSRLTSGGSSGTSRWTSRLTSGGSSGSTLKSLFSWL